ncbi:hypothetical protein Phum_PHUM596550 [Pediculus humanus corporis]|uniref:Uncharacterized protein n=1 Tax=Pediculus humanus subsp. corporis TaxID=121224 RepID=E0W2R3_PEDHC|nr:uncharacterized protein Phum_PHUM596550 [Pediculus humanus corporis]EEB19919.1 hypothetical protein Phum_PHUM596550 [Pediculus humanus corporis]
MIGMKCRDLEMGSGVWGVKTETIPVIVGGTGRHRPGENWRSLENSGELLEKSGEFWRITGEVWRKLLGSPEKSRQLLEITKVKEHWAGLKLGFWRRT